MDNQISERVHQLYWDLDINCARTTLSCLGELFNIEISKQIRNAAIGLHGAGGYRAQCGLIEGALMFIAFILRIKAKVIVKFLISVISLLKSLSTSSDP